MQKTNFSKIIDQSNDLIIGFLSSTWKSKSINLLSVLIGYFLLANFGTKFIKEGKGELLMVPVIMLLLEFIIRIKPSSKSVNFNLWSIFDNVRIGATYAIILEAFKIGS